MFALGCVQALKCNTNKCPTGIATQDKRLIKGLVPEKKSIRVYNFHKRTIQMAKEMAGAAGVEDFSDLKPNHIMMRTDNHKSISYYDLYENVESGSLLKGKGPKDLQCIWDRT